MERSAFDFGSDEVRRALLAPDGKNAVTYAGSAMSHFQSEPVPGNDREHFSPVSDWEIELEKNLNGAPSGIVHPQGTLQFPNFLAKKEKYIARSRELGENMFRISFDFARLAPKEGEFNRVLMEQYMDTLALICARGSTPMVTLYHWPMPRTLLDADAHGVAARGPWEHPRAIPHFAFYIKSVFAALDDRAAVRRAFQHAGMTGEALEQAVEKGLVRHFISVNEPINLLFPTYIMGIFPPLFKNRYLKVWKVLTALVAAHDVALRETRARGYALGVAHDWPYFDGLFGWFFRHMNEYITGRFERDGSRTDFVGFQYYFRSTVPNIGGRGREYTDHPLLGDVYPRGMQLYLERLHALYPRKEMFVTEFGFSDAADKRRPFWILETVRHVVQAMQNGVPVRAILLWSLVDSFEWNLGMGQKFGLFDESELEREPVHPSSGIRSWEAWTAIVRAITDPTTDALRELQKIYLKAKEQYDA